MCFLFSLEIKEVGADGQKIFLTKIRKIKKLKKKLKNYGNIKKCQYKEKYV